MPQLNLNDPVSMTYRTRVLQGDYLWNYAIWDNFIWGERKGYNVNINGNYRLIEIEHDLDKMLSNNLLREL